ncbi:hypothetical protein WJX73_004346 [Symbiochloris irregularis]|uniref:Small ribosomal subunit protein mS29 n=1 Tax=Symbiochloris irregularis TaxID=706552 RepID=A0AAW1NW50_9CHLO
MRRCISDGGYRVAQQGLASGVVPWLRSSLSSIYLVPSLLEGCSIQLRSYADDTSTASERAEDQLPHSQQQRSVRAQAKKEYHDKLKTERQTPGPGTALPAAATPELLELQPAAAEEPTEEPPQPFGRSTSADDVNKLVELNPSTLGEAFPAAEDSKGTWAELAAELQDVLPKGGCKGLQEELQATSTNHVLYRQTIHNLISMAKAAEGPGIQPNSDDAVRQQTNGTASSSARSGAEAAGPVARAQPRQVFLRGPLCAGKSTALAVLVAWAREHDWVALYLPNAAQLTSGGFFPQHSSGSWDTPESAKLALHGLELPGGSEATQIALDVIGALTQQDEVPVLVAIDNYEALYLPSGYGEWMHQHYRRVVQPHELRLAAALQVLAHQPPVRGFVACADGNTCKHRTSVKIPRHRDSRIFEVSRLNQEEWDVMISHYSDQNVLAGEWHDGQRSMAYRMTGGNLREVRKFDSAIFGYEGLHSLEGSQADSDAQESWEPEAVSTGS